MLSQLFRGSNIYCVMFFIGEHDWLRIYTAAFFVYNEKNAGGSSVQRIPTRRRGDKAALNVNDSVVI